MPTATSLTLLAVNNDTQAYLGSPLIFDALCPILNLLAAVTPGGLPGLVLGPFTGGGSSVAASSDELRKELKLEDLAKLDEYMSQLNGKQPIAGLEGIQPISRE